MKLSVPLLASLALAGQAAGQDGARIEIEPGPRVLAGERVSLRLTGLTPGEAVTLTARTTIGSRPYGSFAVFLPGSSGTLDLAEVAPLEGSYEGADALGIFWSMTEQERTPDAMNPGGGPNRIRFELRRDEQLLCSQVLERVERGSGVVEREVREQGLVATYCRPADASARPAVLLVGGSSGGIEWQQHLARLLASRGYCALGLGYFGLPDLPEHLEEIPLEYFGRALAWLREQPEVDAGQIAVCGVSKGGELALLLGATFPELGAVVAYVPSSVVFQSIHPTWRPTSSWSLQGRPLPFVPYDPVSATSGADILEIYRASLTADEAVVQAAIAVEQTRGPVLLISGGDDDIWPSSEMSIQVERRLSEHGFSHAVEHLAFPSAGHSIASPTVVATERWVRNGGSAKANAHASLEAWEHMLLFLERTFVPE